MAATRIIYRFDGLLDIAVTRAAPVWIRLNADGSVSERTASQTLGDIGAAASADLSGYVPTSRTIAGRALSSNITLVSADITDASSAGADTDADKLAKYGISGTLTATGFNTYEGGAYATNSLSWLGTDGGAGIYDVIIIAGNTTANRMLTTPNASGTIALTASTTGIPDALHNATISGAVTFSGTGQTAMREAIGTMLDAAVITGTSTTPGLPTPAQLKLAAEEHGTGGGSGTTVVTLAADTAARVSTTTFANETGLVLPTLEASKPYLFEWSILSTAGAGGVKMQMQLPSSANANSIALGWYGASAGLSAVTTTGTTPRYFAPGGKAGASTAFCQSGSAIIRTGSTGGVPELQWAQVASDASDTKLLAGTMIAITPKF